MEPVMSQKWLIAEYCDGSFYMGWHLYLREHREIGRRNADNSWGWIKWTEKDGQHPARHVFDDMGIKILGDGTCDHQGVAEFAARNKFNGESIGDKSRGGIMVVVDRYGQITGSYPVFCAWCGCQTGETTVPNSHGICEACLVKVLAEFDGPVSGGINE